MFLYTPEGYFIKVTSLYTPAGYLSSGFYAWGQVTWLFICP